MKTKKTNCRTGVLIVLLLAVGSVVIFAVFKLVEMENKKIAEPRQRVRHAEELLVVAPRPFRYVVMPMDQDDERTETSGVDTEDYDKLYDVVEVMPEFPGGMQKLIEFIRTNTRYHKEWAEQGLRARVLVTFVVRRTGKLTDVKILKTIEPQFNDEALRVVNTMPRWTPGKHNGICVDVKYIVPIHFPPHELNIPVKTNKGGRPSDAVIN